MASFLRTLRHAGRRLARAPAFTVLTVLTLALGIGANSAIFSVVNGVVLSALPFPDSERLVFLPRQGDTEADVAIPDGRDLRAQTRSFDELALFIPYWAFDLTGGGEPERVIGSVVEPDYFRVLQTRPLLGRVLTDADNIEGGTAVAVISEGFWRRRFGEDPATVGRSVSLSDVPYTIVGIMPSEFDLFTIGTDVWVPVAVATPWALAERGTNNFEAIARLKAGVDLRGSQADITAVSERLAAEYPDTNQAKLLEVVPLRDFITRNARPILWIIFAAVALVLLIACVNVASLILVRATAREAEVAVRMAMGGSRARIAWSTMGEAILLALAGGALGVLVAVWGTDFLVAVGPEGLPRAGEIGLDRNVLGFTLALSLATALLFGFAPAAQAVRRDPAELLNRSGTRSSAGRGRLRFLNGFVISEMALALVLLIGAGLLVRSFLALRSVELGYQPERIITASLVLPESRYGDPEVQDVAFARMVEQLESEPGVEKGAFIIGAPLTGFGQIGNSLAFDDRPPPAPGERPGARIRPVVGDYFATMGVSILRGRAFTPDDRGDALPVAIVNESFAAEFWPDQDPIGKRVATLLTDEPHWLTVVGVAADVRQNSLAGPDVSTLYIPYPQRQMEWARFGTLVARGRGDPAALTDAIKRAVWAVDPTLPFDQIAAMDELISDSVAPQRFTAALLAAFAVIALLIAIQGIYGVLSYSVAQRRAEIGIRMALGASAPDVLRLVLRRGLVLSAIGLAIGLAVAVGLTRLLRGLLFEVTPLDPATYLLVSVTLVGTALLACAVPARRATRVDPLQTLRHE